MTGSASSIVRIIEHVEMSVRTQCRTLPTRGGILAEEASAGGDQVTIR
jgi:hypothetical protein